MTKPPPSYAELHLECEILKAQAKVDQDAFGNMSQEIVDLNGQLEKIVRELTAVVKNQN